MFSCCCFSSCLYIFFPTFSHFFLHLSFCLSLILLVSKYSVPPLMVLLPRFRRFFYCPFNLDHPSSLSFSHTILFHHLCHSQRLSLSIPTSPTATFSTLPIVPHLSSPSLPLPLRLFLTVPLCLFPCPFLSTSSSHPLRLPTCTPAKRFSAFLPKCPIPKLSDRSVCQFQAPLSYLSPPVLTFICSMLLCSSPPHHPPSHRQHRTIRISLNFHYINLRRIS